MCPKLNTPDNYRFSHLLETASYDHSADSSLQTVPVCVFCLFEHSDKAATFLSPEHIISQEEVKVGL